MAEEQEKPKTIGEWITYVNTLSPDVFVQKAIAFNTHANISYLRDEEGYTIPQLGMILNAFANRFVQLGFVPPRAGNRMYRSYAEILDTYGRYDLPKTPEEAAEMEEG